MPRYNPNKPETIAEFERLCSLEPRLRTLYEEAGAVKDDPSRSSFCREQYWHRRRGRKESLLMRMKSLVGDGAGYPEPTRDTLGVGELLAEKEPNPLERGLISSTDSMRMSKEGAKRIPGFPPSLTTSEAYDVAYSVLFGQLPACRNCECS